MRISIAAIGKSGQSPEHDLVHRYFNRLPHKGTLIERDSSKTSGLAGKRDEGKRLLAALPTQCKLVVLDENGVNLSSVKWAEQISNWRDAGIRDAVFAIGGADGHSEDVLAAADKTLAFGVQTWPHMLVRAMLAEQLYRAEMILARHPYHHT
jgi:23S rRNA (pseudouridine1915-N3)-methyltransferase